MHYRWYIYLLTYLFTYINQKVHVACNFNCLIETERPLKQSRIYCTCGDVLETMLDRLVVTADH